jgi:hypothetical protein
MTALGLHLYAASQTTSAAQASGLVLGRVIDGTSETPLAGIAITATPAPTAPIGPMIAPTNLLPRVITGNDGVFVFRRSSQGGSYTFRATAAGLSARHRRSEPAGWPADHSHARRRREGQRCRHPPVEGCVGDRPSRRRVWRLTRGMSMHLLRMDRFGARPPVHAAADHDDRRPRNVQASCDFAGRVRRLRALQTATSGPSRRVWHRRLGPGHATPDERVRSAVGVRHWLPDWRPHILISASGQRKC